MKLEIRKPSFKDSRLFKGRRWLNSTFYQTRYCFVDILWFPLTFYWYYGDQ